MGVPFLVSVSSRNGWGAAYLYTYKLPHLEIQMKICTTRVSLFLASRT